MRPPNRDRSSVIVTVFVARAGSTIPRTTAAASSPAANCTIQYMEASRTVIRRRTSTDKVTAGL
jgi:hypothetical protein